MTFKVLPRCGATATFTLEAHDQGLHFARPELTVGPCALIQDHGGAVHADVDGTTWPKLTLGSLSVSLEDS